MKAGFLSFKNRKDKNKYSLGDLVKYTKKSESKLIRNYEEMSKVSIDYAKAFQDHLENLEQIDDRVNFNGMVSLFEKIIMKDNIHSGKIDKSSPILFKNYKIEGDVSSSTFRTEHLERQLYYLFNKYIEPRHTNFIKYMTITDITKTSAVLNIITIDNKKYKKNIDHEDYILDKNDVKKMLQDVIHTTKKNLKMQNNSILFNNNSNSNFSRKSKSIKSNRNKFISRKKTSSISRKKSKRKNKNNNNNNNIKPEINKKPYEEVDLFADSNSKRLRYIPNSLKTVFKENKKIPRFSFQKTRSEKDRNAKKIANEKAAAEAKERELQYPPRQENQIAQKCASLQKQECDLVPECWYNPNYLKCVKNTRYVPGQAPRQIPGQAPGQAPGHIPGQAPGQIHYPIPPPNLIDISTNNTNNKNKPSLGETKI
jgi:hypothetical protein